MIYAIVGVAAVFLDQALKLWVVRNLELNVGLHYLIPNFFRLTYIKNTGMLFGLMQDAGWLRWLLLLLLLAFLAAMVYAFVRGAFRTPFARWTGTFLLAGLVGNGMDRALTGFVVDMMEFDRTCLNSPSSTLPISSPLSAAFCSACP